MLKFKNDRQRLRWIVMICALSVTTVTVFALRSPAKHRPAPYRAEAVPVTCSHVITTPQLLAAVLRNDQQRRLPTKELPLRRSVRIMLSTGLCDSKPVCQDINDLDDNTLIEVTNIVAFYPYRFGTLSQRADTGAVIDPTSCVWGFGGKTPEAVWQRFVKEDPFRRSPRCGMPTLYDSFQLTYCVSSPTTQPPTS